MFKIEIFYPLPGPSEGVAAACKSMYWESGLSRLSAPFSPFGKISSAGRPVTGNVARRPHKVHRSQPGPNTALGGIYSGAASPPFYFQRKG